MKSTTFKCTGLAAALSSLACLSQPAIATNGTQLTANGAYSAGMGGVSVALPQDATAAADNPAGMAQVGTRLDLYGQVLAAASNSSFGSPENHHFSRAIVPVPGLGFNYQINEQWTAGVSITGAGLASNYGEPVLPLYGAGIAKANLVVVNTSPTVTYKPLPNLAIGASLILGLEQFRAGGVVVASPEGMPVAVPSHGNSWASGVGGGVGVLWEPLPVISLGASYYTKTWFTALSGYKDDILAASNGHLNSPSRYGVGIAMHPIEGLTVAFDYLRILWASADGYNIANSFNWHNQNVFRVGAAYEINPSWTVRAGYSIASSHLDSDHTLANFYANGICDRAVTFGTTYSIDKSNSITAAFEYEIPRTVIGTGPSTGTNISTNFQGYLIGYSHKF